MNKYVKIVSLDSDHNAETDANVMKQGYIWLTKKINGVLQSTSELFVN